MHYYEVVITPAHGGFGAYETSLDLTGDAWEDENDLVSEMRNNEPELVELGVDELPEGVDDIRGRIHNEPYRVFAFPHEGEERTTVCYVGIVRREAEAGETR
jgi:hypothetical protein